jgi:tetratricopeptide (TPR) repeat protein
VGLLRRVETGDGRIRFGLPEALRRLAGERLDADPGGERWRRRHAEHVCEVLQPARLVAPTRPQFEVARAVGAEAAAALRWAWPADPQLAARIAAAHAAVLADSGRLRETLEVLEPLQRMPAVEPAVELTAIIARLHVLLGAERYAEALGLCDRAVELAGDAEEHSTVALMRGCIHLYGGNVTAALADHVEATRLARRCSPVRLATSLMMEAQARLGAGEVDRVEPLLAEAERIGLPADAYMLDRRMTIYADLSMAVGRPREALERYARSLEWAPSAGNDLQVMFDLAGVANALGAAGEAEAALEAIGMAAAQQAESGGLGADTVSHLMGDAPVREARERLGPERAAECEARGRAVPAALRVDRACRLARMVALDPMPGSDGSLLGERGAAR